MSSSTISPEEAQEILTWHSFSPVYMCHVPPLVTLSPRTLIKKIQSSPYLRGLVGGRFERPRNNRFIFSENDVLKIFERNPDFISKLEAINENTSMALEAPLLEQDGEQNVREEASNALVQVEAQGVDWKGLAWKTCVYLITLGMLVGLLIGLEMSWTTITAALALIVLDFTDAGPSLEKVVFLFCFILILILFFGGFHSVRGF